MSDKPANTIGTLSIRYRSRAGELTQRAVSVTEFDTEGLFGLCHLRDRYRTFRYDRIFSCANIETGEVVYDIHDHIQSIYRKLPRYTLDVLYRNHYEALQILLYVSRADGQLRAAERKILIATFKVLTGDVRITDELGNNLIGAIETPSLHGFKVAAGKVANRGNKVSTRLLLIACQSIVNTQKTVTAAEQEALDYLAKRFA